MTNPDCPCYIDRDEESWCLGDFDQDSISSHHLELHQYQSIDKLVNFYYYEIELKHDYDPDLQLCDLIQFLTLC